MVLGLTWEINQPLFTPAGTVSAANAEVAFIAGMDQLIDDLEKHGKKVVLIGSIATSDLDVTSIVGWQLAFGYPVTEPLFLPQNTYMAIYSGVIDHFNSRHGLIFILPDQIQSRDGRCDFLRGEACLFADSNHLAAARCLYFGRY